jgi:hypothetical protein
MTDQADLIIRGDTFDHPGVYRLRALNIDVSVGGSVWIGIQGEFGERFLDSCGCLAAAFALEFPTDAPDEIRVLPHAHSVFTCKREVDFDYARGESAGRWGHTGPITLCDHQLPPTADV